VEKSWQEFAALPEQAARPGGGGGGGGATPTSFGGKIKPVPGSTGSRTVLSYCTPLIMCLLQFLYNYEDSTGVTKLLTSY